MKRLVVLLIISVLCLGWAPSAWAAPAVLVDGSRLSFDVEPIIENGRTLVPLRAIFEALGAEVLWNGETRTVTALAGAKQIRLTIGQTTAYIDNQPYQIEVPARVVNGRTLVPLRFVSESLGAQVQWEASTQTITITTSNNNSMNKPFHFRNTTWGASPDQVKASEGNLPFTAYEDNESYLLIYNNIRVENYDASLAYVFLENHLSAAYYYLDTSSLNQNNLWSEYWQLEQVLSTKYGDADFYPVWYDEQYIDDPDQWESAVLSGDLDLLSMWLYNDIVIVLQLGLEDEELLWMVGYATSI
jgi:hypothetical protein